MLFVSNPIVIEERPEPKSDEIFVSHPIVIEEMSETAEIKCFPLSDHHYLSGSSFSVIVS